MSGMVQEDPQKPLLQRIHAGMIVNDSEGQVVGKVDAVFVGRTAGDVRAPGEGGGADAAVAAGTDAPAPAGRPVEPLPPGTPPPVPASDPELRAALSAPEMQNGFIRVSGEGLPEVGRLVPAADIERADEWTVYLRVGRAALSAAPGSDEQGE